MACLMRRLRSLLEAKCWSELEGAVYQSPRVMPSPTFSSAGGHSVELNTLQAIQPLHRWKSARVAWCCLHSHLTSVVNQGIPLNSCLTPLWDLPQGGSRWTAALSAAKRVRAFHGWNTLFRLGQLYRTTPDQPREKRIHADTRRSLQQDRESHLKS